MNRTVTHIVLLGLLGLACFRKTTTTIEPTSTGPEVLFIVLNIELKDTVLSIVAKDQMINPGILKEDLTSRPLAQQPTDLKVSILDEKNQVVKTGWVTNPLARPLEVYQEDGKITAIPRPVLRETFYIRTQYLPGMKHVKIQCVKQNQWIELLNLNLDTRRQ